MHMLHIFCTVQVGGYVGSMLAGAAAGWQCDNPAAFLVGGWEAVATLLNKSLYATYLAVNMYRVLFLGAGVLAARCARVVLVASLVCVLGCSQLSEGRYS